jgi:uncharacterized protein YecT (DUF1311 family)
MVQALPEHQRRKDMLKFSFMIAIIAMPLSAQDLSFTPEPTEACLYNTPHGTGKSQCIGRAASDCMSSAEGQTTMGMGFCLDAELSYWDDMLNSGYQQLRAAMQASDSELPSTLAIQADQLRDMQRAWISFRDARCSFEASQWQGGTGASPAFLGCMMTMTGEQALYLMAVFSGEG